MFTIYLIINKLNGKVYIGKTGLNPWNRRWVVHIKEANGNRKRTHLYEALRSYGIEAFDIVKIDETTSNEEANKLEEHYIQIFESHDRTKGYNLTFGGEGCSPTEETRRRMSEGRKGKSPAKGYTPSIEVRKKISESLKGKSHSPQRRANISAAHKGQTPWNKGKSPSSETKSKISKSLKGRRLSPETRAKMSDTRKGKTVTPEARAKMSAAKRGQIPWNKGKSKLTSEKETQNNEY